MDADAAFTSWQCRWSRGHPSSESTCESRRAADSTSRSPSARRCQTSRRSPGVTPCTGSIFHESDSSARQGRTRSMRHTRIIVTHYGGPDALRVVEEECPEPKKGEVRVRVLAAGVSLPDLLMREGVHPETPPLPFTPGWDMVGVVDRLGDGISGIEPGQIVAALTISGAYAQFVCLPQRELVPVPSGLDAAEAVSLVLNYVTAYQMLHRSAKVRSGQRVLIHAAAGGVGSALLQLGRLARLELYATCPSGAASAVSDLGGHPIDDQDPDFVREIARVKNER